MINILVLNSDVDGVGYFRLLNPHLCLQDSDIVIDIRLLSDSTLPLLDINFLSKYQILVYNKMIQFTDNVKETYFFNLLKKLNIKIVYDIDDNWKLDHTHINYKNWVNNKSGEKTEKILKKVDIVITTTEVFANEIRKLNKNVIVIPNAINKKEHQWSIPKLESNRLRFIWGGGIAHKVDLALIKNDFKKFNNSFLKKAQVIMCGYDLRIKLLNGDIKKDDHNRSQWGLFENIFSNNGKYISMEYQKFLKTSDNFDNDDRYGFREEYLDNFYQRRHTKPIGWYGSMYREADVGLAPLKDNHGFNKMKSQLKLIEAGAWGIPVIMSKVAPYMIDDIEKNGLGLYVREGIDHWNNKMQWYLDNPSAVKEHGEANHEYFLKNFEMSVVNKKRIDLYKAIANQNSGEVKI